MPFSWTNENGFAAGSDYVVAAVPNETKSRVTMGQMTSCRLNATPPPPVPRPEPIKLDLEGEAPLVRASGANYFGARLAKMRCSVRRCMLSRRAVSETLRLHIS